jgi:hypothetical protein
MVKGWECCLLLLLVIPGTALGQGKTTGAGSGAEIFHSSCAACHGSDGRGAPDSMRGFELPKTFPDFTDCVATVREANDFWSAIVHNGGPGRGFSEIMPSFREALSDDQIGKVIGHLRNFCREPAWPRGELNLPRAIVTEKAFPEDEMVMDVAFDTEGDTNIAMRAVYERRLGARGQLDIVLPFQFQKPGGAGWESGVGDLAVGYKRVLMANLHSGSIFSIAGETILATGNADRGMGKGVNIFEAFGSFGQILPKGSFFQFQSGIEFPTDTRIANRAVYWRTVLGKSFARDKGLGRLWSPMVEVLADRELATDAQINWDIVPQFQVTLNRRQHVRASVGLRLPINDFGPRPTQVLFYLLWDWFDGGLRDGW